MILFEMKFVIFYFFACLFFLVDCGPFLVAPSIQKAEPPIKPWHCPNEYVKRVAIRGLKMYSSSVDALQKYLEVGLEVLI